MTNDNNERAKANEESNIGASNFQWCLNNATWDALDNSNSGVARIKVNDKLVATFKQMSEVEGVDDIKITASPKMVKKLEAARAIVVAKEESANDTVVQ
jgi:hypothetical protein